MHRPSRFNKQFYNNAFYCGQIYTISPQKMATGGKTAYVSMPDANHVYTAKKYAP